MKRTPLYSLTGLVLGLGSPAGALLWRLYRQAHTSTLENFLRQELNDNSFFYWYMLIGTCLVFTVTGSILGWYDDRLEELNRASVDQAIHDSLTGLTTHSRLHELLAMEFKRRQDTHKPLSGLMIDLDSFDKINTGYGYAFGDNLLKDFAHLLRGCLRQGDIAARYGGEVFFCVLPGCDEITCREISDRIRTQTEKLDFPFGRPPVPLTVSIGTATIHQLYLADYRFLIDRCQANLQKAKVEGRNRVVQSVFLDKADMAHPISV